MSLSPKAKTRIKSRLRKEWYWSKTRTEALNAAQEGSDFKCAECDGLFPRKKIQVDHIDPVIDPVFGWQGWDVYIERMFCPVENLQILCKECHVSKTNSQNHR